MKKLLLILGILALSGTDVLAANIYTPDQSISEIQICSVDSCNRAQTGLTNADTQKTTVTQESHPNIVNLKANSYLMAEIYAPSDRGTQGNRGGGSGSGTR